ncbi:MAG: hypothetical protein M3323_07470 [Actinomycetota bacterium]|nr:hypothetical protein [Actinomycetota bacterium]
MSRARALQGRLLAAACGAALVASSFVPLWATYRVPGLGLFAPETVYRNAWGAYGAGMQLALVLTVVAVLLALFSGAPRLSVPHKGPLLFGLCLTATLSMLWEAAAGPQGSSNPNGYGISRGVLLFAGMGLACGMTYGGYLTMRPAEPDPRTDRADRGE